MSRFGERRSSSFESFGSEISMISSNDENSPGISTHVPASAFSLNNGENEDKPNGCDGVPVVASLAQEREQKLATASSDPADVYPTHEHFYFPAENIYLLVSLLHPYILNNH